MADLTISGAIPGLLRQGSPVWWRDEVTPYTVTWVGPWPDSDSLEDGAIALIAPGASPCIGLDTNAEDLALDLTDATGRAHVAWWLAARAGLPAFGGTEIPLAACGVTWAPEYPFGWSLRTWNINYQATFAPDARGFVATVGVPSLAGLDVRDPRLLPDGSRWVDAEALRRVVLHVAGVPDAR